MFDNLFKKDKKKPGIVYGANGHSAAPLVLDGFRRKAAPRPGQFDSVFKYTYNYSTDVYTKE